MNRWYVLFKYVPLNPTQSIFATTNKAHADAAKLLLEFTLFWEGLAFNISDAIKQAVEKGLQ